MPKIVRWFIKAALVHFVLALLVGLWMVTGSLVPTIPSLRLVYFHLLTVGWVTQLIIGVAYWMFPTYSRNKPRGNEAFGWATFILLNTGLIVRAIGEPMTDTTAAGWLLAISALLQVLAGWLFVINIWPRVRGSG